MGLVPCLQVVANGSDISDSIFTLLESISVTDKTGIESDACEINLIDDPAQPIAMPPRGAELEVSMGYDGAMVKMGMFVVDEIELSGPPEKMTIRGRATVQTGNSKNGKTSLQSQKTRTWPKDTTISDAVIKIAKEHGLDNKVSQSLQAVKLPQTSQSDESDLTLLMRLAKRYDAICKPAGGTLLFVKRGEIDLGTIELSKDQVSNWGMTRSSRDSAGTVIAYWHEKSKAKKHEVRLGEGEPVRRLRHAYTDMGSAKAAAQAGLDESKRGEDKLTLQLPGDPSLSAEAKLELSCFREGIDGAWVIEGVTHTIDKSSGFSTSIEGVKEISA